MGKVLVIKGADFSNVAVKTVELEYAGPTISGIYNAGDCTVILTRLGATNIYYTTDGSTPTTSSTLYQGAFVLHLTGIVTVKAIATFSNGSTSAVSTKKIDYINNLLVGSLMNKYIFVSSNNNYMYDASVSRGLMPFGLLNNILNGFSHISVSINSPFKIARQYWTGIANSVEDALSGSAGNLGTVISNSSSWKTSFEEDIPSNANGIGFVINGDCSNPSAIEIDVQLT